jgi:DNA-binding NtrC family response regulator
MKSSPPAPVKRPGSLLASGAFSGGDPRSRPAAFAGHPRGRAPPARSDTTLLAPHTKVIVITGNAEQENALKAVDLGAADFCSKPIDLGLLKIILDRTFHLSELEAANRRLKAAEGDACSLCGMLGISPVMNDLFKRIRQVSRTDYPVLIRGESGTGKEMVARALHCLSERAENPWVVINCGAIPDTLLESELFGHEKGPSRVPSAGRSANSSKRTRVRSFWTRSATCRWSCR